MFQGKENTMQEKRPWEGEREWDSESTGDSLTSTGTGTLFHCEKCEALHKFIFILIIAVTSCMC